MNSTEIILITVIVFLFIVAIFLFVLLRKKFDKKRMHDQKRIESHDVINITPEFKFESPEFNSSEIPDLDEVKKSIMETQTEEILITEPKIIQTPDENIPIDPKSMVIEDTGRLKLEDTLIEIGAEKKDEKPIIKKQKEKPIRKRTKKSGKKTKSIPEKQEVEIVSPDPEKQEKI